MAQATTGAISRAEVAHLGRLARLALTEEELDHYSEQLGAILAAVAKVSEVATPEVAATSHPLPLVNVFREDEPRPSLSQADALSGAPDAQEERFRVPRILDEE
jgi:aspartyl-tRNA(Asn)/glutamyl-tRNA(Gln) amidotransferase subunit C